MNQTQQLKIEGMSCGHCTGAVEKALADVEGVDRVIEVSLDTGIATIEGTASLAALEAAVRAAGYEVAK